MADLLLTELLLLLLHLLLLLQEIERRSWLEKELLLLLQHLLLLLLGPGVGRSRPAAPETASASASATTAAPSGHIDGGGDGVGAPRACVPRTIGHGALKGVLGLHTLLLITTNALSPTIISTVCFSCRAILIFPSPFKFIFPYRAIW